MTREELNILKAATEILHALETQIRNNARLTAARHGLTEARLSGVITQLHLIISNLDAAGEPHDRPL
jgi:hypothetical protein